jgi:hypothetical protein
MPAARNELDEVLITAGQLRLGGDVAVVVDVLRAGQVQRRWGDERVEIDRLAAAPERGGEMGAFAVGDIPDDVVGGVDRVAVAAGRAVDRPQVLEAAVSPQKSGAPAVAVG